MPVEYFDEVEFEGEKKNDPGESFVDLDYKSNIELANRMLKLSLSKDRKMESEKDEEEEKAKLCESSVELDFKSNIELANQKLNLSIKDRKLPEKSVDDLKELVERISLTDSENSKASRNVDSSEFTVPKAPIGGQPVTFVNDLIGRKALKNGPAFNPNYNHFAFNSIHFDDKAKRSFDDRDFHAVKYKKPMEHSESILEIQSSKMAQFSKHSGGIVTISNNSNEEYDSSFSPGDSNCDSPPEDVAVVSPSSDYSSMASPDNNEVHFEVNRVPDFDCKKESNWNCFDEYDNENKLDDISEVIREERIKEEKKRLEKELRANDFLASSPAQHVPQQDSLPSSSPPSLYSNPNFSDILENLRSTETILSPQANFPTDPPQCFTQQSPPPTSQMPLTPFAQLCQQPILLDQNQFQFSQQQQQQQAPQIASNSNRFQYNLSCKPNLNTNTTTTTTTTNHQLYPLEQIISTTENHSVYNQSQQPVLTSNYLDYTQPNKQPTVTTVSNQQIASKQHQQFMQTINWNNNNNNKQYPIAIQSPANQQQLFSTATFSSPMQSPPQMQSSPQIQSPTHFAIQSQPPRMSPTTNNITLAQPQNFLGTPKPYVAPPPSQHGSPVCLTQSPMQQLTPVLQKMPTTSPIMTTTTTTNNTALTLANISDHVSPSSSPPTSSNKAVIIVTQPTNSPNSIMLVPTTNSQLIYIPQMPAKNKTTRPTLQKILPKPPKSDSNVHQLDIKKFVKSRDKNKSLQNEIPASGNLGLARRCVANVKEEELEKVDQDGDNYIHVAVCKADVYMIEALLERLNRCGKLDLINKQNREGQTPLYLAVSANQPAMVHKLIGFGADVNIKGMMRAYEQNRVERAPIHCAASQGKEYYDTLKELFRAKNIDPNILNSEGLSALHCAIIEHGKLSPNQKSNPAKFDNCQNINLLLRNKANPNLQDKRNGKTPLMYAIESKDYAIVDIIIKGVETSKISELLTTQTFDGRTCMKIAEGLRNEFDPQVWKKLHNFLSSN